MDIDAMEFGRILAELLRHRGMSQKALARASGLTEAAISRYIAGQRMPRATTAAKISGALGVSMADLGFGPAASPEELQEAVDRICMRSAELTWGQKETLIRALARAGETEEKRGDRPC